MGCDGEVELSKSQETNLDENAQATTRGSSTWAARLHAFADTLRRQRERIRKRATLNFTYRVVIGVLGTAVLLVGVVLIPYPGPGWVTVFAGLGLLATEFTTAHRVSTFAWRQYRRWLGWIARQHWVVKAMVALGTGLVVLATLWLLGLFSEVAGWFGVHWPWLTSPLFGG